ncbi:hypothetical protein BH24GEM2_BH24GEM2_00950 [soil metagenome]
MLEGHHLLPLAIDLNQLAHRSVTSLYSNLVTRPTGRAVRMGVESQIAELNPPAVCLSVLDFSSVRVLDYSCADEIVAKLLLRYQADSRTSEVYLLVRGLQEHHHDAIEAVLERHGLLLVVEAEGVYSLLGPTNPAERACWRALVRRGPSTPSAVARDTGLGEPAARSVLASFTDRRVALSLANEVVCPLSLVVRG